MSDIELYLQSSPIARDGELPARDDVGKVFDELDFQLATQSYLWALPLVSWAQWQSVHENVFGTAPSDLVVYRTYRDRLGLITANATTPYILTFFELNRTGPMVIGAFRRGRPPVAAPTSGSASSRRWGRWVPTGERAGSISWWGPASSHPRETDSGCCSRR